jgi:hypothetical protein
MAEQSPFAKIFATWAQTSARAAETAGTQSDVFDLATQAFDPRWWFGTNRPSVEQWMEMLGGMPQFAFPALDRKFVALAGGWLLLMQRHAEHNLRFMQAWGEIYGELCAELYAAAAKGESVHAGRELLDRMVTMTNRKMQEVQRSEDFLASQRKLLQAFLLSRSREREVIEMVANAFDLPTRTEVDDTHRSVHDLKREVRALRRELDRLKPNTQRAPGHDPPRLAAERLESGKRSEGGGS